MKYLLLFTLIFASDVVEIKGLNEKNFNVAKRSGITLVEFWANWNVANKVTLLDSITIEDAKIYRVLIDTNMVISVDVSTDASMGASIDTSMGKSMDKSLHRRSRTPPPGKTHI